MISSETTKNGSRAAGPESVTSHELLWRCVVISSSVSHSGAPGPHRTEGAGAAQAVPSVKFLHIYVNKSIAIDPQRHPWHWSCPCRTEELARFWLATVAVPDHATPLRAP